MIHSTTETRQIGHSKALHTVVFVIAMLSFVLNGSNTRAASVTPSDYPLTGSVDKFDETSQFAVAFKIRPRRRLRSKSMELAIGKMATGQEHRLLQALGPALRFPANITSLFFDFVLHDRSTFRTGETS